MSRVRVQRIIGDEAGFTLIELLAVAVILIILSLMALPVYAEVTDKGRTAKSTEELRIIEQGLEAYRADRGQYPARLVHLVDKGYLKPTRFHTPWSTDKNPIYYFYAVDNAGASDVATRYVLGDPGPGVSCTGKPIPCGKHPKTDWSWGFSEVDPLWNDRPDRLPAVNLPPLLRRASH